MKKILLNIAFIATSLLVLSSCSQDSDSTRMIAPDGGSGGTNIAGGGTGKGGSFASMTIYNNYIYTLHENKITILDISDLVSPTVVRTVNLQGGRNHETIFPYEGHLLLGTSNSMEVYSLQNPENPMFKTRFTHVFACDPVVAEDGYAYVTLNGVAECRGTVSQLDVLDIRNINSPKHVRTVAMEAPRGLGIDNNTLFVCDKDFVKVFNVESKENPIPIANFPITAAYDVIPFNNTLIVSSAEGIHQYDYTNPNNITFLSLIKVVR